MNKFAFYFKIKLFYLFIFFIIVLFSSNSLVYAFNPNNYEKDSSSYHNREEWKHEEGTFLSSDAKVFYNIKGVQMISCKTYQEWLNKQQATEDSISIASNFIPIPFSGIFYDFGYKNLVKPYLLKDFLPKNNDKIAMFNEAIRYSLKLNHGRGFFFFNNYDLNNIKKFNITFCKCNMSTTSDSLIEQIKDLFTSSEVFTSELWNNIENEKNKNNLTDESFLNEEEANVETDILIEKLKRILGVKSEQVLKSIKNQIQDKIVKKINKKVGHTIAKQVWKKTTKKVIGDTFGKIFMPGIEIGIDKAEQKIESEIYIVKKMSFDVKNNSYEKTIGFCIDFPSEEETAVYEIKNNDNGQEYSLLIQKENIVESSHMLIDILTKKKSNGNPEFISIYNGKMKK
ncbi:MAG: hypothetical protein Q2306_01625 [Phytoplasma sp.]|uniref:hypothetical protein n=1 Tax=Phytoplasma sp. TaxID=2155 RepID=UPI002B408477|nr:hypothetical protein [Phytoplasma sp.]WRH06588.1 MAG: hypothetical protein Q2306_01625 [Phytoplasma sp.]